MSFIPNTTCRRCHRQYPSFRGRCPYCGTKKVKEVRSAVPETDSAVPGTRASRNAAEALSMQMLIGGGLLLAVIVLAIVLVSVNVKADVANHNDINQQVANTQNNTPIPIPTSTPEPTPSPQPPIKDVQVRWGPTGVYDYVEMGGFSLSAGNTIPLCVLWTPASIKAVPEWTVDDETIVSIEPNESGIYCNARMVGEPGQSTVLHVKINEREEDMRITIT